MMTKFFKNFNLPKDFGKELFDKAAKLYGRAAKIRTLRTDIIVGEDGKRYAVIAPKVEGRVVNVTGK